MSPLPFLQNSTYELDDALSSTKQALMRHDFHVLKEIDMQVNFNKANIGSVRTSSLEHAIHN